MKFPKIFCAITTLFFLYSCMAGNESTDEELQKGKDNPVSQEKRYLALGDSYTIGESVASDQRFPVQLQKKLVGEGLNPASPEIVARTGWTTTELADGIRQANPQGLYDLVTLLIGVNNQYRGLDTAEYRLQFRQLLSQAALFAGNNYSRVIVLSIPDYGVTPFGLTRDAAKISREIDRFNRINYEETRRTPAEYIDITPVSRQGLAQSQLVAPDGLHPSGEQYRLWVELILPAAKKIMSR